MDKALILSVVGLIIASVGGFGRLSQRLGNLELKIDTMWQWWTQLQSKQRVGGRRWYDPPADEG